MSQIVSKHPLLGTDSHHQVHRCIEIGLRCVEVNPETRPSAGQILLHIFSGNPHVQIRLMHNLRGMLMRTADALPRRSSRPPEPGSSSRAPVPRVAFDPFDVDTDPPSRPELTPKQIGLCSDALAHFKNKGKRRDDLSDKYRSLSVWMTAVRFCLFYFEAKHGCCYWVALMRSIGWGI